MKLVIVGLGGVGTHMMPSLMQYLNFQEQDTFDRILLIDGDSYEVKNKERQIFDTYGHKSEVTAETYKSMYPDLEIAHDTEYVTESNIDTYVKDGDVVLLSVDNHSSRLLFEKKIDKLDNLTVINGGNEYHDGNVMVMHKKDGVMVTPKFTEMHREIASPQDRNPGEMSCQDLAQVEGGGQLVIINNQIAAIMNSVLFSLLNSNLEFYEIFTDSLTASTRGCKLEREDELEPVFMSVK